MSDAYICYQLFGPSRCLADEWKWLLNAGV
jgi:hypothetical protein